MKHISSTTGKYVTCTASKRGCPNKGHMSDGAYSLLQQNPTLNKSINKFNEKSINKNVNTKAKPTVNNIQEPFNTVGIKWENGYKFNFKTFVTKKIKLEIQ